MRDILEDLQAKSPQNKGPLSEIELWRDRASSLSRIAEQTKREEVQRIVKLYARKENVDPEIIFEELNRYYREARDNVK